MNFAILRIYQISWKILVRFNNLAVTNYIGTYNTRQEASIVGVSCRIAGSRPHKRVNYELRGTESSYINNFIGFSL